MRRVLGGILVMMGSVLCVVHVSGCSGGEEGEESTACSSDGDCAGDRVCRDGVCELPQGPSPVQDMSMPAQDMGTTVRDLGSGPSCFDNIQNGDEEGVDCGGMCFVDCSNSSEGSCSDGVQNRDEEGVDCGGQYCFSCPTPSCFDNIQNGDEEGVDCGGTCFVDCTTTAKSCSGSLTCEGVASSACDQVSGCNLDESTSCRSREKSGDYCARYTTEAACDGDILYCTWSDARDACEDSCGLFDEDGCTSDVGCRWSSASSCVGTPTVSCMDLTDEMSCQQAGCTFE